MTLLTLPICVFVFCEQISRIKTSESASKKVIQATARTASSSSSGRSLDEDQCATSHHTHGNKQSSTTRKAVGGSAALAIKISDKLSSKSNADSHKRTQETPMRPSKRNSVPRLSIHEPNPVSLQTLQPREREMTLRDRTSLTYIVSGTTAKIGEDSLLHKHQNKILRRTFRDNVLNRRSLITSSGSFLVGVPGSTRLSEMSTDGNTTL